MGVHHPVERGSQLAVAVGPLDLVEEKPNAAHDHFVLLVPPRHPSPHSKYEHCALAEAENLGSHLHAEGLGVGPHHQVE